MRHPVCGYLCSFSDHSPRGLKPFAPTSIDEIKTGMRVLVTRSSGRIGKGTVKWKGKLDGHSEHFIGIELETPSECNFYAVFLFIEIILTAVPTKKLSA